MRMEILLLPLLVAATAFPQSSLIRDFYYILSPREADSGQSVTFEAREYNGCLYGYDVTYELLPTPISPSARGT